MPMRTRMAFIESPLSLAVFPCMPGNSDNPRTLNPPRLPFEQFEEPFAFHRTDNGAILPVLDWNPAGTLRGQDSFSLGLPQLSQPISTHRPVPGRYFALQI